MLVLGIETSCDDTGVALYDSVLGLQANVLASQVETHAPFGGVVPELASRDHIRKILPLIQKVFSQTHQSIRAINGIAYTCGPGLAGALLVGAMVGRTLGLVCTVPAVGIHHLEGHLLSPFILSPASPPCFPLLALLVSGGHTELIYATQLGVYQVLGETLDDAAGEVFDKIAKLIGLGYPGGARLAQLAEEGDPRAFHFPRPMMNQPGWDFSFSGLKTHVSRVIAKHAPCNHQIQADIAASLQAAIVEVLAIKCYKGLQHTGALRLVVAGGVSANKALRKALGDVCQSLNVSLHCPDWAFCTDNGAMIAYAGCQRLLISSQQQDSLSVAVYPRWALSALPK